jgi:NAD(P)-dependent dehydrogenase (short-subunit alcohol dehydrogenase family)
MDTRDLGVVVTGGASGLGEATAKALAAGGARVALLDLNADKGNEVAKEIGGGAFFAQTDVTSEAEVSAAVDEAVERFGAIHVNVNCAGIGSAGRTIGKDGSPFDLAYFRKTIDINLVGTFNVLRLCAAKMVDNAPNDEGERGVIINTASIAAFDGQIGQCAYSASKGGIVGMTLPIARDLSRAGIRILTIAPGLFGTPLLMTLPESARQALASNIPFPQRLGHPQEFAQLAVHMVENTMLNGEVVRLDGALRMAPK